MLKFLTDAVLLDTDLVENLLDENVGDEVHTSTTRCPLAATRTRLTSLDENGLCVGKSTLATRAERLARASMVQLGYGLERG